MSAASQERETVLQALSNNLAAAIDRAAQSVVAVHARPRIPSSGVLWRPGVVVTAAHTIRKDGEVTITLPDGGSATATAAGRDRPTDVAVFKLNQSGGSSAEFAASSAKIGQIVLQVGRTGTAGPSASFGVVSAILTGWRTWHGADIDQILELDLSIHDGFSGSALVDAGGRVLGLNTSGLARGAPLALPALVVDRIVDTLLTKGRVGRGYLGVGLQPVDLPPSLSTNPALEQGRGLMVLSVDPSSPAGSGGVLLGDVILRVGGVTVTDVRDVFAALSPERVGSSVDVEVLRGGSLVRLRTTIVERPPR